MDFIVISALIGTALGFGLCWMVMKSQLREKLAELASLRSERTELHERAITAEVSLSALEQRMREREEQMNLQFKDTASQIFDDISKKSEKQIGDLLSPLRERIVEFQKLVSDNFGEHGKEQHTLKAEIGRIVAMNEQMRLQAENLTKALRGDVKAQGNWGEMILERILEESGLQKGIGYTVQGEQMGLSNADGGRQQPDVIINLPDAKHIIIDSKVTLTHYERYCSETDETQKDTHLKLFLRSVRTHVDGLTSKAYQDNDKLVTPDFVLMFMPIEGAFSLAVQHDKELHSYAWQRKVAIVCPSTLFISLRTIASVWRVDQQNKNTQEIVKRGNALYDKFVGFVTDMKAIGDSINRTQKTYDSAMNKLSEGKGSLVWQAEDLRKKGLKSDNKANKAFQGMLEENEEETTA